MLGSLPQQGIDTPFTYNGFQCYVGVWIAESGNWLKVVAERVKGGGQYGNADSTTWATIKQEIDPENKAKGNAKAYVQAFLDASVPDLKKHVGLEGSVTPPFPAEIIDQIVWLVKYAVTFNPATGKFTVA